MQMVAQYGAEETARGHLASGTETSDGFVTLYEGGRINLTIESRVLLPSYQELFSCDEISTARRRLQDHRYGVDRYLEAGSELAILGSGTPTRRGLCCLARISAQAGL